jgi:hypothetical protein
MKTVTFESLLGWKIMSGNWCCVMHPSWLPPHEFGAIFLAQVTALAFVQLWRIGRQASHEELGNRPRPSLDGIHLILTSFAVVLGVVLLVIIVSSPRTLPKFGGSDEFIVPFVAFLIFVYVMLVVGIRSSHQTSGDRTNPWLRGLSLLAAGAVLLAAMELPILLLPHTQVPQQ